MAKHLTDREKKKIIADYAECGNYSQVARKHKVSFDTVKRVVISDPETVKKAEQKKSRIPLIFLSLWTRKKMMCAALFPFIFLSFKTLINFNGQVFRALLHRWASLLTNSQKTRRNSLTLPSLRP